MSAASVTASTAPAHGAGPGSTPRAALQSLWVSPVPVKIAKELVVRNHYLHSLPGGTQITFGVFLGGRLLGVVVLGVGSFNAKSLVKDALAEDCLTLTRLWLSDDLPKNSESRVIGTVVRLLKKHTELKFILSYADPAHAHVGTIYQAAGWIYTGLSVAMPLYDIGDGDGKQNTRPRRRRSRRPLGPGEKACLAELRRRKKHLKLIEAWRP